MYGNKWRSTKDKSTGKTKRFKVKHKALRLSVGNLNYVLPTSINDQYKMSDIDTGITDMSNEFLMSKDRETKKKVKMALVSAANKARANGFPQIAELYEKEYKDMYVPTKEDVEKEAKLKIEREKAKIEHQKWLEERKKRAKEKLPIPVYEEKEMIAWYEGAMHPKETAHGMTKEDVIEFRKDHSLEQREIILKRFKKEKEERKRAQRKSEKWKEELRQDIQSDFFKNKKYEVTDLKKLVSVLEGDENIPEAVYEYRDTGEMARLILENPTKYLKSGVLTLKPKIDISQREARLQNERLQGRLMEWIGECGGKTIKGEYKGVQTDADLNRDGIEVLNLKYELGQGNANQLTYKEIKKIAKTIGESELNVRKALEYDSKKDSERYNKLKKLSKDARNYYDTLDHIERLPTIRGTVKSQKLTALYEMGFMNNNNTMTEKGRKVLLELKQKGLAVSNLELKD